MGRRGGSLFGYRGLELKSENCKHARRSHQTKKNLSHRETFCRGHSSIWQDHSRGRVLTTTGQPTVSSLPHLLQNQSLYFQLDTELEVFGAFARFSHSSQRALENLCKVFLNE